jgi:hypothetical protein
VAGDLTFVPGELGTVRAWRTVLLGRTSTKHSG